MEASMRNPPQLRRSPVSRPAVPRTPRARRAWRAAIRSGVSMLPVVLLGALLLGATSRTASAAWPALGRAITTAPNNQDDPRAATDGAGGAIITWRDDRGGAVHIFAQHVRFTSDLDAAWPVNGLPLLTDAPSLANALGGQSRPVIVSDGAGGAIVAWQDQRNENPGSDIFAQHVLSTGVVDPNWPANGRALSTAPGAQDHAAIVSDGAGGAIVTWQDGRNGDSDSGVDIFAQHVLSSGIVDPNWPANGRALSAAPSTQAFPKIASDRSGGAIVTWHDFRSPASGVDIYAGHVLANGVVDPAWPVNGLALTTAAGSQIDPAIVSDGGHGAIVAWTDARDVLNHIFAQRVLVTGAIAPGWPANGLAVCTAPVEQITPAIASDGADGAIVTWQDLRNEVNHNPFVQHVLGSGSVDPAWPVNGRALSLSDGEATSGSIVVDGSGGAFVSWEEDAFVKSNHVFASGLLDPTFPVNGAFARLDLSFQLRPDLVAGGAGNAIVAWANNEIGAQFDIFAQLVGTESVLSVPGGASTAITFAPPSPNPARERFGLRFTLPHEAGAMLAILDVNGRRVRSLASGSLPAGEHVIGWDLRDGDGRAVRPGVYFARLEVEGRTFTRKLVASQ